MRWPRGPLQQSVHRGDGVRAPKRGPARIGPRFLFLLASIEVVQHAPLLGGQAIVEFLLARGGRGSLLR